MRKFIDIVEKVTPPSLPEGFGKWFNGSKVVDNGNPIICYHGTFEDFFEFSYNPKGRVIHGFNRLGFWFDTDIGVPNWLAGYDSDPKSHGVMNAGSLMPCYLSIKKPFYLDSEYLWSEDQEKIRNYADQISPMTKAFYTARTDNLGNMRLPDGSIFDEMKWRKLMKERDAFLDKLEKERSDSFSRMMKLLPNGIKSSTKEVIAFQQELISEGHDGIYLGDTIADFSHRNYDTSDWWIAFYPNQIKSIYARKVSDSNRIDE